MTEKSDDIRNLKLLLKTLLFHDFRGKAFRIFEIILSLGKWISVFVFVFVCLLTALWIVQNHTVYRVLHKYGHQTDQQRNKKIDIDIVRTKR